MGLPRLVLADPGEDFSKLLILEGHQNCCIGSKVAAILLNEWRARGPGGLLSFQGVTFKFATDRGKITAILGLGGGQNLLLVVLFVNTDNGKQQQNTVVSGKRGKRQVATNAFKKVKMVSE